MSPLLRDIPDSPRTPGRPGSQTAAPPDRVLPAPLKQSPPAPRHTSRPETCSDNRRLPAAVAGIPSDRNPPADSSRPAAGAASQPAPTTQSGTNPAPAYSRGRLGSLGLRGLET